MDGHERTAERRESLWMLVVSPTVWALHFLAAYITGALWCGMVAGPFGSLMTARIAIAAYTLVALVIIVSVGTIGFRRHRLAAGEPPHDEDTPEDRHRFMGYATFLLSGISAIGVVYAAMAIVFLEGCQ
jgi:uncharacterized membrane protein